MDRHRPQARWWFLAGATLVTALNLLSTRMAADELSAEQAGDLRSLLGALSAVSVMALGMQLVLVSLLAVPGLSAVRHPRSWTAVMIAAAVATVSAALVTVLSIESTVGFELEASLSVSTAVAALVLAVPARAVLLGRERWGDLVIVSTAGALVRLALTSIGRGDAAVHWALAGVVAGEIVATGAVIAITRDAPRADRWPADAARRVRIGGAASIGLMLLIVASSLSVERFLGDAAQLYNRSASVARSVFVLLFTVAFVFFPPLAREPLGSSALRRTFHVALVATTSAAVVVVAAAMLAPGRLADLVADDAVSASTVRLLAVAFACYGVAVVPMMQYLAHGSRMALLGWPMAGLVLLGHLVADSPDELAAFVLAAAVVLLATSALPAIARVQPALRPAQVDRSQSGTSHPAGTVSVVIPSYNAGPAVVSTVHEVLDAFDEADIDVEVIVVSDGGTDGSDLLVEDMADSRVTLVRHELNRGKGAAVRTGFALARGTIIGFVDADGDLPPRQLPDMARILRDRDADIVFGSKRHAESTVHVPAVRRVYSRTFQFLIRHLFQLDIADTQTGIKLYSAHLVRDVLPVLQEDGFALDLEMFVAARANGFHSFVEVPVTLRRQAGSTISSRSAMRMLRHTLGIFWRAKVLLQYLRVAVAPRGSQDEQPVPTEA